MSNKISKLREERSKNDEKIARLQSRNGEIDKQITELENLEIIGGGAGGSYTDCQQGNYC